RASRREPPGAGSRHRPRDDHQPEPRFRGGSGDAARQRAGHARIAVRRQPPGLRSEGQARVLFSGTSRGEPGAARRGLPVRPLRRPDAAGDGVQGAAANGAALETMPKRTDIKSVLIIGAGPIVIGQACEFDYSGAQACKALREEGYRVILVNSNPATIMTDPNMADATY